MVGIELIGDDGAEFSKRIKKQMYVRPVHLDVHGTRWQSVVRKIDKSINSRIRGVVVIVIIND